MISIPPRSHSEDRIIRRQMSGQHNWQIKPLSQASIFSGNVAAYRLGTWILRPLLCPVLYARTGTLWRRCAAGPWSMDTVTGILGGVRGLNIHCFLGDLCHSIPVPVCYCLNVVMQSLCAVKGELCMLTRGTLLKTNALLNQYPPDNSLIVTTLAETFELVPSLSSRLSRSPNSLSRILSFLVIRVFFIKGVWICAQCFRNTQGGFLSWALLSPNVTQEVG